MTCELERYFLYGTLDICDDFLGLFKYFLYVYTDISGWLFFFRDHLTQTFLAFFHFTNSYYENEVRVGSSATSATTNHTLY